MAAPTQPDPAQAVAERWLADQLAGLNNLMQVNLQQEITPMGEAFRAMQAALKGDASQAHVVA